MRTTTDRQFQYFVQRCEYWIKQYKITGWKMFYEHVLLEDSYATIFSAHRNRIATISLSLQWPTELRPLNQRSLDASARHEIIHLLTRGLTALAGERFLNLDELKTEDERVVRVLEELLP